MDIINSPLWKDYTFQVVLAGTVSLGILCGILGSFIVLRREALLGDGIAHSAYPVSYTHLTLPTILLV